MVIAKLNCNQMLINVGDGRVFVLDRRTPNRMEQVQEASPPQEVETTRTVIPFQPRKFGGVTPIAREA